MSTDALENVEAPAEFRLLPHELRALQTIRNGAEVFDRHTMLVLRELELIVPPLVILLPAQAAEGEFKPYFFATLSPAGARELAKAEGGAS
jgi:hypothetical protein